MAALLAAAVARADYNPVAITPGSYTADIVVEKTAPPPLNAFTTATMDGGTNNGSNTYFERGYDPTRPLTGLPHPGEIFTAANASDHQFQMPPSYATNNVVFIASTVPSGSLVLTTPAAFSSLSLLYSDAGGDSVVSYTVHHQDGTSETGTFTAVDWFNTTTAEAYIARGRINMDNGQFNTVNSTTQTKLFNYDITINPLSPVTSVDFAFVSGNRAVIFGLSGSTGAGFTPVAVSGFNRDVVVEVGAPSPSYIGGCNVVMDSGATNVTGNTWYEIGFDPYGPTTGLPAHGTTFTTGTKTFRMAPDYTVNNCVYLGPYDRYTTATLNLASPAAYTALSVLDTSGNGPVSVSYMIYYQDGSIQNGTFSVLDWFNSATAAYVANGRCQPDTCAINNRNGGTCKLWSNDIGLNNTTSPVTRIDFTYVSGGRAAIFAVSGQTVAAGPFNPINVTGFNADIIVEATQKLFPGGLFSATTGTMDQGTLNYGNTWFEQGWYTNAPAIGLPAAGSTINSLANATRHYVLPATYVGPNAVLIDTNHQVANITPVTPGAYTSLSLLTAGASIGAANTMSNLCIVQHADGSAETNLFFGYDWFNTALSPAYIANGRMNASYRSVVNQFGGYPRLFESQFALNNVSSPVTNIQVQYKTAGGANWTTYVLAVSASTDAVAPILAVPTPTLTTMEGSNVVLGIPVSGTLPITFQWQYSLDGTTWANLNDGGTVSGVTSSVLTFTSIGWTNAAQYRLTAANAIGAATNGAGTLTILSGSPDVTRPGDPISIIAGTTTTAEVAGNAIDNTTTKWLNFDATDNTAPFVGPVGCVVTPSQGSTILSALRFYTANDATERDPADYVLEGSNDGGANYTLIAKGPLALSTTRNAAGLALNPFTLPMQEVHFTNVVGYTTYKLSFNNVRNNTTANSMQIGEVEFLGLPTPVAPVITLQPAASVKVWVGASPTLSVAAKGYPTNLTYQWKLNGNAIAGATSSSYIISNVQASDSGKSFTCTVANTVGSTTSSSATLSVIGKPTQAYPVAILADNPVAYWRLNETPDNGSGNNGTVANDYWGGHSGVYSNAYLGQLGYNPKFDTDPAAQFGYYAASDSYVANIGGIDFAAPTNTSVALSVEAWVKGPAQTMDAGIITKGFGGGGEQFNLDTGGSGHPFRFFVRNVAGQVSGPVAKIGPDDKWHHVVGVCDQANSNVLIYVDGLLSGSAAITPGGGLLASANPVSIGSRQGAGQGTPYNNQFNGTIDEVAIYNVALSSNQVLNHYFAANPAPAFALQPTNTTTAEGSTVTFYSSAYGPAPLSYQWYQSADGVTFAPMAGKTSANLVLPNVAAAYNNYQFQVVATNPYGSATGAVAVLTLISGPPMVVTDLPYEMVAYAGRTVSFAVTVGGTAPFSYQWKRNGANLADDVRTLGARSNVLTIANAQLSDSAKYQLVINNSAGVAYSMETTLTVQARPGFNNSGLGWGLNGNVNLATVVNNVLGATAGTGNSASSAFYSYPLYIGSFTASFTYQDVGGGGADGTAFVLHNDPRGVAALGGAGGSLGFTGISPSAALEFNIYSSATLNPGMAFNVNGATGGYISTYPVDVSSGNPIEATLVYNQGVLQVTLKDTLIGSSFTTNFTVGSLPAVVGADTAYVGFTGADGGTKSTQNVSNFSFVPFAGLTAQTTGTNTVVLSWPSSVGGYVLQSRSDLSSGSWQNVTMPVSAINGQVIVPATGSQFYRLVLP